MVFSFLLPFRARTRYSNRLSFLTYSARITEQVSVGRLRRHLRILLAPAVRPTAREHKSPWLVLSHSPRRACTVTSQLLLLLLTPSTHRNEIQGTRPDVYFHHRISFRSFSCSASTFTPAFVTLQKNPCDVLLVSPSDMTVGPWLTKAILRGFLVLTPSLSEPKKAPVISSSVWSLIDDSFFPKHAFLVKITTLIRRISGWLVHFILLF